MVQGALKARSKQASTAKSAKVAKGQRMAKPRRKQAVAAAKVTKKHTASLTGATEKLLASRVGHLEILKGTRKELEKAAQASKAKAKKRPLKPLRFEPAPPIDVSDNELPLCLDVNVPQVAKRPRHEVVYDEFDLSIPELADPGGPLTSEWVPESREERMRRRRR